MSEEYGCGDVKELFYGEKKEELQEHVYEEDLEEQLASQEVNHSSTFLIFRRNLNFPSHALNLFLKSAALSSLILSIYMVYFL